jgi:DNA polymerase-3 subunit epsilon
VKILWVDMETGGVSAHDHDITQLSGIVDIDGEVAEEFDLKVCPSHASRVTEKALAIQGRTLAEVMAHPMGRREAWRAWRAVMDKYVDKYTKGDRLYWGGHMAPFDMSFGRVLFEGNGDTYFHAYFHPFAVDLGCVVAALRARGHLPDLRDHKLGTICSAVGVDLRGAHDALHDIRATREAFYKLAEMIPAASTRI